MTSRGLNATAALRFPRRRGRYRPHPPYRPTAHPHKPLRADGTSLPCALPSLNAPNRVPTFAHGPRGRRASTPWPSGTFYRAVGQRGPPLAARRVGTTLPGRRARAAGAVAKIGTVCLRAKKTHIGLGAIMGGVFGRFYARRYPGATGANVGVLGQQGNARGGAVMKARFCPGYRVARTCGGRCATCKHVIVRDLPPGLCPPRCRGRLPVTGWGVVEELTVTVDDERTGSHAS
jgi:hypothetical protein